MKSAFAHYPQLNSLLDRPVLVSTTGIMPTPLDHSTTSPPTSTKAIPHFLSFTSRIIPALGLIARRASYLLSIYCPAHAHIEHDECHDFLASSFSFNVFSICFVFPQQVRIPRTPAQFFSSSYFPGERFSPSFVIILGAFFLLMVFFSLRRD